MGGGGEEKEKEGEERSLCRNVKCKNWVQTIAVYLNRRDCVRPRRTEGKMVKKEEKLGE